MLKKVISTFLVVIMMFTVINIIIPTTVSANTTTYYVDPNGNDSSSGTSTGTAWKTLSKVSATTFQAGDRILFKAGSTWTGQLWPKGSGSSSSPISVDKYGTGNNPIIAGGGVDGAVKISEQSYIEYTNLEITNHGTVEGDYSGVLIKDVNQIMYGIKVTYCNIHDVNSKFGFGGDRGRGGIFVAGIGTSYYIDGLYLDNNTIHDVQIGGIYFNQYNWDDNWGMCRNVFIRNNTVYNTQGDGIVPGVLNSGLVEHNLIYNTALYSNPQGSEAYAALWPHTVSNLILQYNESYNCDPNGTCGDGVAWDFDAHTSSTIYQYNYSHHNAGGWLLDMNWGGSDNIARYNISQDDGYLFNHVYAGDPTSGSKIYNNTIYTTAGKFLALWSPSRTDWEFRNNIVQYHGSGSMDFTNSQMNGTWTNNCFYGNMTNYSTTNGNIYADPLLVNAGSGGNGINTVGGYNLQESSPCINKGVDMGYGGNKDYFGNTIPTGIHNIGADESFAGMANFRSGFESGDTQPNYNNTVDWSSNVTGYFGSGSPDCSIRNVYSDWAPLTAHSGVNAEMYAGSATNASSAFAYMKAFEVNIPITSATTLDYWINPIQANGRYVAVDFHCADGSTLRDSGAVDQNGYSAHPKAGHGGNITLNAWSEIKINVGQSLAGKTIDRIWIAYDHTGSTGQYRGYIDDISITNDHLNSGSTLTAGSLLKSLDGTRVLRMQTDGNLVIYTNGTPTWSTSTYNAGSSHLIMQPDGNLVVYKDSDNSVVWTSNTWYGSGYFSIENDGHIRLYTGTYPSGTLRWTNN